MAVNYKNDLMLDRDAWLRRGLEVLRDEGIVGVRVERLARDLGVTKGSFYWHFQDRNDLFSSLLEFWKQQYTDVVIQNPQLADGNPTDALLLLMTQVRKQGLDRYELAMRSWADHDQQADAVVRAVYRQRTEFVRRFFTQLGFRGLDTEARTRLVLCYLSWEPSMYQEEPETRKSALLKRQVEILTTR